MKVADIIENTINRLPCNYIFTYLDFDIEVGVQESVRRHLSRLVASGRIVRASRGKFYKPEISPILGALSPSRFQLFKDLLEDGEKRVGYITGYSAFNELSLTTQVSNTIQIGTNEIKKPIERGIYKIRFVLQRNTITKDNIPLLKILDAIRYIKSIPDATIDNSITILCGHIEKLTEGQLTTLVRLAMKYSPSTRALLGAMVENLYGDDIAMPLRRSLNGISKYNIGVGDSVLPNLQKWSIK